MLQVGLTGGIGAGKSTVAMIFRHLSIPVYDADSRAKLLMQENLMPQIIEAFGEDVYDKGILQTQVLASKAFSSEQKTAVLNAIVHPAVAKNYEGWALTQNAPYCINEAALLIEAKSYKVLDKLIVVTAPQQLRIERVMKRNSISREAVEERMNKQMPESEKIAFADFIIINDGEHSLISQVLSIHKILMDHK